MTKLNEKPLSQMLEEIEPNVNTGVHGSFMTDTSITQTILPMVDRASYDKLKAVAIELAKTLEYAKSNYELIGYDLVGGDGAPSGYIPFPAEWTFADKALSRAKDIIGGKDEN